MAVPPPQAAALHALGPALAEALARFEGDAERPFKARLERLVRELPAGESDALMMLMKESRGAWAMLLERAGGRALFLGDGFSGTPVALGTLGFDVTVASPEAGRLRFACDRADALAPGTTRAVVAGADGALPFQDGAFDLVVLEGGLPSSDTGWGFDADELRRVCGGELVVSADNRLGYKRSTGRRGAFRRHPLHLLGEVLAPSRGERTLTGTRAAVKGPWAVAEAYSLYPHAREFSHVVGLDGPRPRLTIGPRERKNRLKMLGKRLGLFSWLTPSFAVHARRSAAGPSRVQRLLARVAEACGDPCPEVDMLVATRSNDALMHTAIPGRRDAAGRWTVHVALQPAKRRMVEVHHAWLTRVRERFPGLPVPQPLFHGVVEGAEVAVERRLDGLNGTDVTGDERRTGRMFDDASRQLVDLLEPEATLLDGDLFDRLLQPRFDLVMELIASDGTRARVRRMVDRARDQLVGRSLRLGVYHADLRAKHLQLNGDGSIAGYLDWGASEERFLPLVDLLHLVVHQRKQETGGTFGDAWRSVLDPGGRRPVEQRAFHGYLERAGLEPDLLPAVLELYPALVAGMAELNWDYSRPDWVRRQFEL
ncbi:MAG: hypothetical protein PVJ89_05115 [Planctomycetota bacterium]|jgi:hypothetical protein